MVKIGSLVVVGVVLVISGCAQVMAIRQRPPMDRSILRPGVDRTRIIGVLGVPIGKDRNDDGTITEVYKYSDGGTKNAFGSKASRVLLYTAGDVFTLCLSQVVWMPMELAFEPTVYTADVTYEKSGGHWVARDIREIDAGNQKVTREASNDPESDP